ncbi:MAG: DUF3820 family protein [Smithella sp.]
MIMPFGKFKGMPLEAIDESYLIWLAKGEGYTKNRHSTEMQFKIPAAIWIESRKILESRGYKIRGERIEK